MGRRRGCHLSATADARGCGCGGASGRGEKESLRRRAGSERSGQVGGEEQTLLPSAFRYHIKGKPKLQSQWRIRVNLDSDLPCWVKDTLAVTPSISITFTIPGAQFPLCQPYLIFYFRKHFSSLRLFKIIIV